MEDNHVLPDTKIQIEILCEVIQKCDGLTPISVDFSGKSRRLNFLILDKKRCFQYSDDKTYKSFVQEGMTGKLIITIKELSDDGYNFLSELSDKLKSEQLKQKHVEAAESANLIAWRAVYVSVGAALGTIGSFLCLFFRCG